MRMMNGRGGRKASESHSSLSLDMSLSKALNPSTAPVNQQWDEWLLLGSSSGGSLCVTARQCPLPAETEVMKKVKRRRNHVRD